MTIRGKPSEAEMQKILAEAEKIHSDQIIAEQRAIVELRKLGIEADKAALELTRLSAEVDKARSEARATAISVEILEQQNRERLASDYFYNRYFFANEVDPAAVQNCIDILTYWDRFDPKSEMEICFTSPGGSALAGFVLFDFIQYLRRKGHKITTSSLGMAASMAAILLQAGDVRILHKEAVMLLHEMSIFAGGKISEIEDVVEFRKKQTDRVLEILAERCKQAGVAGTAKHPLTKATIKAKWARKDWWLSSQECLDYGLIDEIR